MTEKRLLIPRPGPMVGHTSPNGLLLPRQPAPTDAEAEADEMHFVHTYITWEEISGAALSEDEIIDRLAQMSAYDVLSSIGRLSCHAKNLKVEVIRKAYGDRPGFVPLSTISLLRSLLAED